MPWDRNDYAAAGLILALIIMGIMIGLYLSGFWNPIINTVFPFR